MENPTLKCLVFVTAFVVYIFHRVGATKDLRAFKLIEDINKNVVGLDFGDEMFNGRIAKDTGEAYREENELRAVTNVLELRWNSGIVPYKISPFYNTIQRDMIFYAMKNIEDKSCINFINYNEFTTPPRDFIHIKKVSGCWSYVGRNGGEQTISLVNGCVVESIIQHELLHALGIWHEQSRRDRDTYVDILTENILPGRQHNFDIRTATDSYGVPYDPVSIMHYHNTAFSRNGKNTINWKANPFKILGGSVLTDSDIKQLNLLYECDKTDKSTTTTIRPTTMKPTTMKPTTMKPTTMKPTTMKPTVNPTGCNSFSSVCGDYSYSCVLYYQQGKKCDCDFVKLHCPMTCGCCVRNRLEQCLNFRDKSYHCRKAGCFNNFVKERCARTCCERGHFYK